MARPKLKKEKERIAASILRPTLQTHFQAPWRGRDRPNWREKETIVDPIVKDRTRLYTQVLFAQPDRARPNCGETILLGTIMIRGIRQKMSRFAYSRKKTKKGLRFHAQVLSTLCETLLTALRKPDGDVIRGGSGQPF